MRVEFGGWDEVRMVKRRKRKGDIKGNPRPDVEQAFFSLSLKYEFTPSLAL